MNFKLAIRNLRKAPFVTVAAIISLGLGIGANAAIFSIYHQVLVRELPVQEPERLVNLSSPGPRFGGTTSGSIGDWDEVFSYPMFRDLEKAQTVFTGIAAHVFFDANVVYQGLTEHRRGLAVSGSYFSVLELQPALGRLFDPTADSTLNEPHAVVLSYDYWQKRLAGDPRILNQEMVVNGQLMTIVGVAPNGFRGTSVGNEPQIFVPLTMMRFAWPGFDNFSNRTHYWAFLFARLKPGVTIEQASSAINGPYHILINEVDAPLQQLSRKDMDLFKAKRIKLENGRRGQTDIRGDARIPLTLLLAVTAFVLLIACVNITNLLLARGASRVSEMAVRLAIGASRRQLIVQLLTESGLLALSGGIAGLVVGQWTLNLIASLIPPEEALLHYELDSAVLVFTGAVTLVTGLLVGLFPAWQSTRLDLTPALKGQSNQIAGARRAGRTRSVLATAQIALSMALLVLAGLFTKSLFNISKAELGLIADHVVTFRVSPRLNGYTVERMVALYGEIEDAARSLPGVSGVTTSEVPLLASQNWGNRVGVQGFESGPDIDSNSKYTSIGTDYFRTLGIHLLSGREFSASDAAARPKVAIVNEQFAKKFNLGRDAVGKRMTVGFGKNLDIEIIGLAQNSKYSEVKSETPPVYYLPYRQALEPIDMSFYIRTSLDPDSLLKAISPMMAKIDRDLPVQDARTLPEQIRQNVTPDRLISILSAIFASIATILAGVGLYGVLAYTVAQRTREFGVRIALGAAPGTIHGLILGQLGRMALVGGSIGAAGALEVGRFAESLLFRLNGHDPAVLAIAAVLLSLVAFAAGFIPAHRASKVNPIMALRYE